MIQEESRDTHVMPRKSERYEISHESEHFSLERIIEKGE